RTARSCRIDCEDRSEPEPYRPWPRLVHAEMIFIGTHHKSGTILFWRIFRDVAVAFSLEVYPGIQRKLPPTTQIWFMEHSKIFPEDFTEITGIHVIRHPFDLICSGYRYHLVCNEAWCVSTAVSRAAGVHYDFDGLSYQQKLS